MKRVFSLMAAFVLLAGTVFLSNPVTAFAATYDADLSGFTSVEDGSWVEFPDSVKTAIEENNYNQMLILYDYESPSYPTEVYHFIMYDGTKYNLGTYKTNFGSEDYNFGFCLFDKDGNQVSGSMYYFYCNHVWGGDNYSFGNVSSGINVNRQSFETTMYFDNDDDNGTNPIGTEDKANVYDNILYTSRSIYEANWENGGAVKTGNLFYDVKVTLAEIAEDVNMFAVLDEIIALLPVAIPVLIGFIALRKGISFIQGILRSS